VQEDKEGTSLFKRNKSPTESKRKTSEFENIKRDGKEERYDCSVDIKSS